MIVLPLPRTSGFLPLGGLTMTMIADPPLSTEQIESWLRSVRMKQSYQIYLH